jgi:hypothetical protein
MNITRLAYTVPPAAGAIRFYGGESSPSLCANEIADLPVSFNGSRRLSPARSRRTGWIKLAIGDAALIQTAGRG